jgi:hypothetical protein
MIRIKNTEQLTGVSISGDFNDLDAVVDAIYALTVSDMDEDLNRKTLPYMNISTRVLGMCYDIRHAAMGDREVFVEENGIEEIHMRFHEERFPRENVYYSCNILYPEMILNAMALNDLIDLRMDKLASSSTRYYPASDPKVMGDRHIAVIRLFQSAFYDAVASALSTQSMARFRKQVLTNYHGIHRIKDPFVDEQNIDWLKLSRESRVKKINSVTKRLAEFLFEPKHQMYAEQLARGAKEHQCDESDLRFPHLEYPEVVRW